MYATGTVRCDRALGAFAGVFSANRASGLRFHTNGAVLLNGGANGTIAYGVTRGGTLGGNACRIVYVGATDGRLLLTASHNAMLLLLR
jgi:hypothetical protein